MQGKVWHYEPRLDYQSQVQFRSLFQERTPPYRKKRKSIDGQAQPFFEIVFLHPFKEQPTFTRTRQVSENVFQQKRCYMNSKGTDWTRVYQAVASRLNQFWRVGLTGKCWMRCNFFCCCKFKIENMMTSNNWYSNLSMSRLEQREIYHAQVYYFKNYYR